MATHQEIAGVSDEDLVNRMISSHTDRFDDVFWTFFQEQVEPNLTDPPIMVDLGCGPGLLLRDLRQRCANAILHGIDVTKAMIDYANNKVEYQGEKPQYSILDVANDDLPFSAESVDLVSMVAVMHVLSEPLPVLEKIQKVLKPGGVFLLQDWIRTSLPQYLERMTGKVPPEQMEATRSAMFKLFPSHNKYTTDDWLWVLEQGGFRVVEHKQLRSPHFCTFVCTSKG